MKKISVDGNAWLSGDDIRDNVDTHGQASGTLPFGLLELQIPIYKSDFGA